jgi:putative component of membrane protein insertase Oxa1/YidC/SpoIIIJ protein YidD
LEQGANVALPLQHSMATFVPSCSSYADDAALFFNSRDDLERGASSLFSRLLKFGPKMRIDTGVTPSKTEAMYFPRLYSDADTSRLDVLGDVGNSVCFLGGFNNGILKP